MHRLIEQQLGSLNLDAGNFAGKIEDKADRQELPLMFFVFLLCYFVVQLRLAHSAVAGTKQWRVKEKGETAEIDCGFSAPPRP